MLLSCCFSSKSKSKSKSFIDYLCSNNSVTRATDISQSFTRVELSWVEAKHFSSATLSRVHCLRVRVRVRRPLEPFECFVYLARTERTTQHNNNSSSPVASRGVGESGIHKRDNGQTHFSWQHKQWQWQHQQSAANRQKMRQTTGP